MFAAACLRAKDKSLIVEVFELIEGGKGALALSTEYECKVNVLHP